MWKNDLPPAIICDIDGTLALLGDRNPYDASQAEQDELNHPIANILEVYSHQTLFDVQILLVSGREDKYRPQTERWLKLHDIRHKQLYMRQAGDFRKDTIVKREIYARYIQDKYHVIFVLDDRDQVVKMWRQELGLTCLQVEYGAF
jgi:hypothetical protein